jgi:hypothetical protein
MKSLDIAKLNAKRYCNKHYRHISNIENKLRYRIDTRWTVYVDGEKRYRINQQCITVKSLHTDTH